MNRFRAWSIRLRITLGSVLIATIVLAGAAAAIHFQAGSITQKSDETLAVGDLSSFEADIRSNPTEPPDTPAAGVLVVVRDPGGRTVIETVPRELHDRFEEARDGEHQGGGEDDEEDNHTVRIVAGGTEYVVVSRTVVTPAGQWSLWSARSAAASNLTTTSIDRSLLVGIVIAIVAFGGAAWLLATAALRPVARMRSSAEALSRGEGSGELPVGPADDELSALARTLNDFISQVRTTALRERQMVSDASHELRTPLAVVATQLELAHASFGDAAALEREVLAAEVSLARLSRLATMLLELSQIEALEASGAPGRGEQATGAELVSEVMLAVDRARLLAGPDGISVEFDASMPRDAERYPVSPTSFGRIVDNLVMNSIAACDPGGRVTLDLRQLDEGLRVVVTDTGTGIPHDFLPLAFGRFSRPDSSRARSSGGSGLGLALVQALVDRARGSVSLENGTIGAIATVEIPTM